MARWNKPDEIEKDIILEDLTDDTLEFYHDQMHIFWKRIEEGIWFDWTFRDVYNMHKSVVIEMLKRKITHLHPINELDQIEFAKDVDEMVEIVNKVKHNN